MAGKPRKHQSRKRGRRGSGRPRFTPFLRRLSTQAGVLTTICLAIAAGAALGYGLGLLDREAPERTVVTAPEQPSVSQLQSRPQQQQRIRTAQPRPDEPPPAESAPPTEEKSEGTAPPAPVVELAWARNAAPAPDPGGRPAIAIVIDDVGLNPARTRKVVSLPAPVTLAFLTYAERLPQQTAEARAAGHELLVHFPMEPLDPAVDPGPNALLTGLDEAEMAKRLHWGLSRFDGYVGVNNHMGSRFTTGEAQMRVVLGELKARGLLFLDSATSSSSVGARMSRELQLPHAVRDIFLDNSKDRAAIRSNLALLEQRARRHGHAVGIGHPYDETIEEIQHWMKDVRDRGFVLVPLTAIVRGNAAAMSKVDARPREPAG